MSVRKIDSKPGHWRIRVVVTDSATGRKKEVDRIEVAANKRAALVREMELREELHAGRDEAPTVKAYCDSWFKRKAAGEGDDGPLRRGTLVRYGQHLDRFIAALGHVRMDALTPAMIKAWLSDEGARPREGTKDGTLSGYTLLGMLRVVRTVTRDATSDLRLSHWRVTA